MILNKCRNTMRAGTMKNYLERLFLTHQVSDSDKNDIEMKFDFVDGGKLLHLT